IVLVIMQGTAFTIGRRVRISVTTFILSVLFCMGAQLGTAALRYVDVNSANPIAPYADWATAATNIQDAVDAASTGDTVLVTNGLYNVGARLTAGSTTSNRVVVTNAITVQSVNGYQVTTIQGVKDPVTTNGLTSVRCVYLANGGTLRGFTITNGSSK